MKIVLVYAVGAVLAIGLNLLAQELVLVAVPLGGLGIFPSVLAGTVCGLAFKYTWDKALIFRFTAGSAVRDLRTFLLYGVTGAVTTLIFWGFEFGFEILFGTKEMRYTGAVIGLVIGYVLKYRLDSRLVFVEGAGR
jgi:putative flippase GtrA